MEDYVKKAQERKIEEICFTPHIPLPDFPRGGSDLRMAPDDLALLGFFYVVFHAAGGVSAVGGVQMVVKHVLQRLKIVRRQFIQSNPKSSLQRALLSEPDLHPIAILGSQECFRSRKVRSRVRV